MTLSMPCDCPHYWRLREENERLREDAERWRKVETALNAYFLALKNQENGHMAMIHAFNSIRSHYAARGER